MSPEQAWISVNGERVAEGRLKSPVTKDPNDGLQIGDDLGSRVVADKRPGFSGLIESVRLYSGIAP
jgi:hypothetical protein